MSRTVVITGATGGLGIKTAHAFAAGGHSLVLLAHDQAKLDALTRDLNLSDDRLHVAAIDLRDVQAVRATAETVSKRFGGAHALIHLVGGWVGGKSRPGEYGLNACGRAQGQRRHGHHHRRAR